MCAAQKQYCGECFALFDTGVSRCPRCGKDASAVSGRDYQQKLMHALEHPLADVRMRAIVALGLRGGRDATEALLACARRTPTDVVEGLEIVRTLRAIFSDSRERGALAQLAEHHPAHAVRMAARRALGTPEDPGSGVIAAPQDHSDR